MQELKMMVDKLLKQSRNAKEEVSKMAGTLEQYRSIGTPQECMEAIYLAEKINRMADTFRRQGFEAFEHPQSATEKAMQAMAVQQNERCTRKLDEKMRLLAKYQEIGTIEEFKALKEKSVAKMMDGYYCPICRHYFEDTDAYNYCPVCGQKMKSILE